MKNVLLSLFGGLTLLCGVALLGLAQASLLPLQISMTGLGFVVSGSTFILLSK
jgi:hypothetical protein